MAGIGIRFSEFARRLPEHGIETTLLSPAKPEAAGEAGGRRRSRRPPSSPELACNASSAAGSPKPSPASTRPSFQGHLANHVLLEAASIPTVVDLYDPWLRGEPELRKEPRTRHLQKRSRELGAAVVARRLLHLLICGATSLLPRLPCGPGPREPTAGGSGPDARDAHLDRALRGARAVARAPTVAAAARRR